MGKANHRDPTAMGRDIGRETMTPELRSTPAIAKFPAAVTNR